MRSLKRSHAISVWPEADDDDDDDDDRADHNPNTRDQSTQTETPTGKTFMATSEVCGSSTGTDVTAEGHPMVSFQLSRREILQMVAATKEQMKADAIHSESDTDHPGPEQAETETGDCEHDSLFEDSQPSGSGAPEIVSADPIVNSCPGCELIGRCGCCKREIRYIRRVPTNSSSNSRPCPITRPDETTTRPRT